MFLFDLLPPSVPCCRSAKFHLNVAGDLDHVISLVYRLVYNMDEWRICGNAEFNAIFLRWKLEDFNQMAAGWGPV